MDRYAVFPLLERIACCLLAVLLLCSLIYLDLVSRDAPQYFFYIPTTDTIIHGLVAIHCTPCHQPDSRG